MITIGTMAKAFYMLPSQVAAMATSYDLMIMDVMATWEEFKNDPSKVNYNQESLEEILKKTRS